MQRCDGSGDLRGVVDLGEGIVPRAIDVQMLVHILHQVPDAFAGMIPGTLVMDITKGSLNGIRPGTVGR